MRCIVGVWLVYAVMAFADGLGIVSSRTGLGDLSSTFFFLWFAVVPIPVGIFCRRMGTLRVLRIALVLSAIACILFCFGMRTAWCPLAGFSLAGLSNVVLQVVAPVWIADRFPSTHLAGVLTEGLFVKTSAAVAFPFAVSACAASDRWWLSLVPIGVASVMAACMTGGTTGNGEKTSVCLHSVWRVLQDPVVACAAFAFALAIVADIAFNLSVPTIAARRFGDASVGVTYAVFFGVKLPLMLVASRFFRRFEARRSFGSTVLVSLVGALVMSCSESWTMYLIGVGLFAAGFANVYGHVFGSAAPHHSEDMPSVASLLVMAISAGVFASPLMALVGECGGAQAPEKLVLTLVACLLPIAIFLSLTTTSLKPSRSKKLS